MNILFCVLSMEEFNRIRSCKTAKDIWNNLEVTHEGTNQVKESKISMLVHKYELFKMKHAQALLGSLPLTPHVHLTHALCTSASTPCVSHPHPMRTYAPTCAQTQLVGPSLPG